MATRLRRHSISMTTRAGSGHATSCLSAADLVAALFFATLRFDVRDPDRLDNDRFVLSKGHAAPLLYAAWAEAGAIPTDFLQTLRMIDSELEGHPTPRFPWVDVATGSLGQGLSAGLGMAYAMKLDERDARVYVLLGDGELMEGSIWEAAELAPRLGLDNVIAIADVNRLGQSDPTMLEWDLGQYAERFEAFGWNPIQIDGHEMSEILTALKMATEAKRETPGRPTVILARTIKGKGVSFLEDKDDWHGKAVEPEDEERALGELDESDADLALSIQLPSGTRAPHAEKEAGAPGGRRLSDPDYARDDEVATRTAFGNALVRLGEIDSRIVTLDGDVKNSTRSEKFLERFPTRFIEGYIAEQNLVGMAVGLQVLDKVPFFATFACFLTRAFDQIRMAGISQANIKLCGSHAGVSIGEDGPSQMGLEDLAMMRAIPDSIVLYPSDAVSTERLVELAAEHQGISYIRTTRPKTPIIYDNDESFEIGGFKVHGASGADRLTVIAAGITLHEALDAQAQLRDHDDLAIRVIDLYGVKPLAVDALEEQIQETGGLALSVEDHYRAGGLGEALAAALSPRGIRIEALAVDRLPRSGKPEELLALMRIDAAAIVEHARSLTRH